MLSHALARPLSRLLGAAARPREIEPCRTLITSVSEGTPTQVDYERQFRADRQELLAYYPMAIDEIKRAAKDVNLPDATEYLVKAIKHSLPHGRMFRGCTALNACRELMPHQADTGRLGLPLATIIELMQVVFIMVDDMVDKADERWGVPCWHTLPGVGVAAATDAMLVEASMYEYVIRHFRREPGYTHVFELLIGVVYRAWYGQTEDAIVKFDKFSAEAYEAMDKQKISSYMFYAPTGAAMHLAGISDERSHKTMVDLSHDLSLLFTVQDDFDDCFKPESVTGKTSLDIKYGKLTWMIGEAKRRASDKQLAMMKENYGSGDQRGVDAVLDVYEQLGIREAAIEHMREQRKLITTRIEQQRILPRSVLYYALYSLGQPLAEL